MKPVFKDCMQRAVGCDIGPASVRVVELGKFLNKIVLLHADEEKLDSFFSPLQAVRLALRRLYDRSPRMSRDVVLHVEGRGVRHLIADAPADTDSLDQWVITQVMQRLPEGMSVDDLTVSYHIITGTEDHLKLWITCCQSRMIDERLQWAEASGVEPVLIGGGALDVHHAFLFAFDDAVEKTQGVILIRENGIICSITEKLQPVMYEEMPVPDMTFDADQILNACLKCWQESGNLHLNRVIWVDARHLNDNESPLPPPDKKAPWPVLTAAPLSGLPDMDCPLSPGFSLAAGLALKRFYPGLNTINLLPEIEKERVRLKTEKQRAIRWILAGGGFFMILLFILNIIRITTEQKLTATEEMMIEFNDQIHAIELTKKEQNKLIHTLEDMRQLMQNRSDYSRIFEEISRIMPREAWLETFALEPVYKGRSREKTRIGDRVILQGWSLTDSRIALLISNLESSVLLEKIRLEESEQISGNAVFKQTGQYHESVIHFRVTAMIRISGNLGKNRS